MKCACVGTEVLFLSIHRGNISGDSKNRNTPIITPPARLLLQLCVNLGRRTEEQSTELAFIGMNCTGGFCRTDSV